MSAGRSTPQRRRSRTAGTEEVPPGAAPALRDRILEFRRVPREELVPNPRNWRRHPEAQREALREVLAKVGVAGAVLAYRSERNGGRLTLIDGALRQEEEDVAEWPTLVLDVDDAEADHLLATFDPVSMLATTDAGALASLLAEVTVDAGALGDLLDELSGRKVKPGRTDPDDAPHVPTTPTSRPGDVWTLGEHRLLVGDATKAASWKKLELDAPAVVFTDPPYGMSIRNAAGLTIAGDDKRDLALEELVTAVLRQAVRATPADTAFYVWHAEAARDLFANALGAAGLLALETVLWVKPSPGLGAGHYRRSHEPCLYAARAGQTPRWYGGRAEGTVWRLSEAETPAALGVDLGDGLLITDAGSGLWLAPKAPRARRHRRSGLRNGTLQVNVVDDETSSVWEVSRDLMPQHPTQKPVALARRALLNSSEPGDLAIDPFGGSGSTLIAAEQTGRRARLLEIDPRYADVVLQRWATFTGGDPVRQDGATWNSLAIESALATG